MIPQCRARLASGSKCCYVAMRSRTASLCVWVQGPETSRDERDSIRHAPTERRCSDRANIRTARVSCDTGRPRTHHHEKRERSRTTHNSSWRSRDGPWHAYSCMFSIENTIASAGPILSPDAAPLQEPSSNEHSNRLSLSLI